MTEAVRTMMRLERERIGSNDEFAVMPLPLAATTTGPSLDVQPADDDGSRVTLESLQRAQAAPLRLAA